MVNVILTVALFIAILSILLSLIRFIKGPTSADRLVAFDVMTVTSVAIIGLITYLTGRIIYLDVAIVYGLLSFLGVLIVARYFEKGL
ncbi:MAG TPA: monovalent cation/H+ antiporter complex subunit F [Williamwhitmania sp.]|nr:monovalent cation/H+ antiporter complex subunit F [Williamwhitmania sp.]